MDAAPTLNALADESVVVIGSGFGGLSVACYLADAGAEVTVVEKNDELGGRAGALDRDGFRFDLGLSWYQMPDVFKRFFRHFDRTPDDYYTTERLDPQYRVFWKDGDWVDVSSDLEHNKEIFEGYEPGAAEALERYLETAEHDYEVGIERFVYENRARLRDYVDLDVIRCARGLSLLGSMQGHVEEYFGHPKLQQLIQHALLFRGSSPTNSPALYNAVTHVDLDMGVHYPEGGMTAVVDGIVDLGEELGVEYVTGTPVEEIAGHRGSFAVRTDGGGEFLADLVVSNADYAHTEQELLPPEKRQYTAEYWESRTYAPSAFCLFLGVEGDVTPLAHRTFVLPTNWDEHFAQLYDDPAWPDDPAYYLCVPSRTDDGVTPEGHSTLSALVPIAPGLKDTPEQRETYRNFILDDIADHTGVDIRDRIVVEERFAVDDFAERYNSYRGSAFGLAHTFRQMAPLRPSHCSSILDGLYFTGADTAPGIGAPMCLISGLLTAESMAESS